MFDDDYIYEQLCCGVNLEILKGIFCVKYDINIVELKIIKNKQDIINMDYIVNYGETTIIKIDNKKSELHHGEILRIRNATEIYDKSTNRIFKNYIIGMRINK